MTLIPVEKIASGTLGNLLYYVAIIGVLLVIATLLRLKIPFLRKAFIPASLLAGLIGLVLGPHVLGVIPADMMSSIGSLPTHMITVVFACMLLGVKKTESGKNMVHDTLSGLGWLWSCSFMQVGVACLLCAFIFTPMMGVNPLFGSLFEIGFAGGHGTAGGMSGLFQDPAALNWTDGADLGMTTATIGLLLGIFGGMKPVWRYVVMGIVGVACSLFGIAPGVYMIATGDVSLLHSYHYANVAAADLPRLATTEGVCMIALGIAIFMCMMAGAGMVGGRPFKRWAIALMVLGAWLVVPREGGRLV